MPFCYHSSLLNGQVKFFQGKYVLWIYLLTADDLEKKPIWIPATISYQFTKATYIWNINLFPGKKP